MFKSTPYTFDSTAIYGAYASTATASGRSSASVIFSDVQRIEDLRVFFEFRDTEVSAYLLERPYLIDSLLRAIVPIRQLFPGEGVSLEVWHDEEVAGLHDLTMKIFHAGEPVKQLNRFLEQWYVHQPKEARRDITVMDAPLHA